MQSNAKSKNGFDLQEIRSQGGFQLRNPNPDFMDFLFTDRLGKSEKGFAKLFSVKRKSKNRLLSVEIRFRISRSIANPKSRLPNRTERTLIIKIIEKNRKRAGDDGKR